MENEFGTCLEMHERAPFRAVVGIGRQQRSGGFGLGRQRLLVPDRRRCCLPAARRRHGLGRGRRAGQPHARQLDGALSPRRNPARRCARRGLSGAAASLGRHALRHLDALTLDLFTGQAESLKCGAAPLCAHGRALERARREIASRRPFRREKPEPVGAAAAFPRRSVHHGVRRRVRRAG